MSQELEVAEVREEVRLHHGHRTFCFAARSPPSQSVRDRSSNPLHSPLVEIDGKGKPEQAGPELLRHGEWVRRAICEARSVCRPPPYQSRWETPSCSRLAATSFASSCVLAWNST